MQVTLLQQNLCFGFLFISKEESLQMFLNEDQYGDLLKGTSNNILDILHILVQHPLSLPSVIFLKLDFCSSCQGVICFPGYQPPCERPYDGRTERPPAG